MRRHGCPSCTRTCTRMLILLVCIAAARVVLGAVQEIPGEAIEGFDPCQSGSDSAFGGSFQVVATKPSSASDFIATGDGGQNCATPMQRCGDVAAVEAECRALPGCTAFNYDGRCGYLKTAAQPRTPRAGWNTYVLSQGADPASAGSPAPAGSPAGAAPQASPAPIDSPAPAGGELPPSPAADASTSVDSASPAP